VKNEKQDSRELCKDATVSIISLILKLSAVLKSYTNSAMFSYLKRYIDYLMLLMYR